MHLTNYTSFAKGERHETSIAIDYRQPTPKRNDFLQGIDGGGVSNSLLSSLWLGILRDTRHWEANAMSNVLQISDSLFQIYGTTSWRKVY
jgi:hypothetical protein